MKKLYIYGIIALAAIVSCNKTEISETSAIGEQREGYGVIYATTEATKTTMAGSGIYERAEWVAGDEVMVFPKASTLDSPSWKKYTTSQNGPTVAFTGEAFTENPLLAIYPFSASRNFCNLTADGGNNSVTTTVTVPDRQDGSFRNVIFAGKPKENNPKEFVFTAIISVIKLVIPREDAVVKIILESDQKICGNWATILSSNSKSFISGGQNPNQQGNKITVEAASGNILSGPVYITVLPTTNLSNLEMTIVSKDRYGKHSNSVAIFKANTIEDFGVFNLPLTKLTRKHSVSLDKQVDFSHGNLQYKPKDATWKFAENEWDWIGYDSEIGNVFGSTNSKNSESGYEGYIDLLSWGGTGHNNSSPTNIGWNQNYSKTDLNGTDYDWGYHCNIAGDQYKDKKWRTLTKEEWSYLLTNHSIGPAKVNGQKGFIILPDYFFDPMCNESYSNSEFVSQSSNTSFDSNIYNGNNWSLMSNTGAIFLPRCGCYNAYFKMDGNYYWSSTCSRDNYSYSYPVFLSETSSANVGNRWFAGNLLAVRLVRDVPAE